MISLEGYVLQKYAQKDIKKLGVLKKKGKQYTYHDVMHPLLRLLQLIGRFPYGISDKEFKKFSFFSVPAIYSGTFYLGTSALCIWSNIEVLNNQLGRSENFQILVFWLVIMAYSVQTFLVPVTYWKDAPTTVQYFQQWARLEEQLRSEGFVLRSRKTILVATYIALPITILYLALESYVLSDVSPFIFVQFVPIFAATFVTLAHWAGTLFELASIAKSIAPRIAQTRSRRELAARRDLALKLNMLTRGLGYAIGWSLINTALMYFLIFVLCLYGALADITRPKDSYFMFYGLILASFVGLGTNYFLCETSQRATQTIVTEINEHILKSDFSLWSPDCQAEVMLLLKEMSAMPPVVEYNGYVTSNRQTFTSIIGNSVTYLIVLVQFNGSANISSLGAHNRTQM